MKKKELVEALRIAEIERDNSYASSNLLRLNYQEQREITQRYIDENRVLRGQIKHCVATLAIDTVLQKTHRERNETLRFLVRKLTDALKDITYPTDMDNIPF